MNEEIINGVDVSGCEYAEKSIPVDCNIDNCFCNENKNCYYKQLKRVETENQELGKIIDCKNGTIASLAKIRDELKQENKRLKEELAEANQLKGMYHTYYRAKHDDIKGIIFKQKAKLEKIKEYVSQLKVFEFTKKDLLSIIEGAKDE